MRAKSLYAFDFDGTLSPIVSEPTTATLSVRTKEVLRALSRRVPVAVISGRSVADLRSRVGIPGITLVGNHGMERDAPLRSLGRHFISPCRQWITQLELKRGEIRNVGEFDIEDKAYSLSIHYRRSRHRLALEQVLYRVVKKLRPRPRVIPGKCILNLIPESKMHKGQAVCDLMRHFKLQKTLYVGDDVTDEDVFGLDPRRVVSVRVGRTEQTNAQFYLERQTRTLALLEFLEIHATRGEVHR